MLIPNNRDLPLLQKLENILKCVWKCQGLRIVKTALKRNNIGELTIPSFKTYYKAALIKTTWYWYNDRHINQQNRSEIPKNKYYIYSEMTFQLFYYSQLTFDNSAKPIQRGKNSLFNKWYNWIATCKRINLNPFLSPCIKINSK